MIRRPIRRWFPLFMGPMVCAFIIGFVYPFCKGIYLSFCKFKVTSDAHFVGLENYRRAFQDVSFVHSFWFTALFAVISLVLINVLAFAVAYALTQGIKGSNLYRTVFFMPNLIGGIVLGYIWSMIFDGILSRYGTSILLNTKLGFWGLIILMCWQQIGYMMIIYIAGLQAVPEDMLEAAKIDGASRWQTLWKVTIPNVMPSITICTFLSLTNGFKLFDQNLALTGGQPYTILSDGSSIKETEMLALNILNTFYGQNANSRGTAQAKAVLFFILVATIGLLQLSANSFKLNTYVKTDTFALPNAESFAGWSNFIKGLTFGNYPFLKSAGYSLFITIVSTALILLCTSMAAWYIARVDSKFCRMVYYLCIFSMVVPFQMVMFTLSKTADTLKLNTPWTIPIIYLGFGAGLAIFMFVGFVKSIPLEIEEAAAIDGCGPLRTYFSVVLPMLRPTMISVGILEIMWVWNDYLLPYLVLDRTKYMTIPIHIQYLKGSYGTVDLGATMALILLSIIPVIVFYLLCQKYIIKGVAAGAVKG